MKDININFKNFYEWPILLRAVLIGIICLVVFYLGYIIDFSTMGPRLEKAKQQEEDLKQQFNSLFTNEADLKAELQKYPLLTNAINQWQNKLIASKDLSELLNDILKIGAQNGLIFTSFNPEPEQKKSNYNSIPIKAVILGSYDQISSFISQVANMPRLVSIGNFTLSKEHTKDAAEKKVKGEVILEIYEAKNK